MGEERDDNSWLTMWAERERLDAMPAREIHRFIDLVNSAQRVMAGNLTDLERHCALLADPTVALPLVGNNPNDRPMQALFMARASRFFQNFLGAADGFRDILHGHITRRVRSDVRWNPVVEQLKTFDTDPRVVLVKELRNFSLHQEAISPSLHGRFEARDEPGRAEFSCSLELDPVQLEAVRRSWVSAHKSKRSQFPNLNFDRLIEAVGTTDVLLLSQRHFAAAEELLFATSSLLNRGFGEELATFTKSWNDFRVRWSPHDPWGKSSVRE